MSALERSYERAERVTAEWARSFYFASRFLPRPKRRAIFALYDYCRHADNLVDERGVRSVADARRDLDALAEMVTALHGGARPGDERADSGLERLKLAGRRAPFFGEPDERAPACEDRAGEVEARARRVVVDREQSHRPRDEPAQPVAEDAARIVAPPGATEHAVR